MKSILLVGAGQLGSRHLQSIARLPFPAEIFVVDPFEGSLAVARERYAEIETGAEQKIVFVQSIEQINAVKIDYAVIATTSDVRFDIFKSIANKFSIKYVIFEKVLFQRLSDYADAKKILDEHKIKAWVNCPRRLYPFYQKLKNDYLVASSPVEFNFEGGLWGLGCNSIHYIDALNYLTEEHVISVDSTGITKNIIKGKRERFIEFGGLLSVKYSSGSKLTLLDNEQQNTSTSLVSIKQNDLSVSLEEFSGAFTISIRDEIKEQGVVEPVFQSNLTSRIILDIEQFGDCGLANYSLSMSQHVPFVGALLKQYQLITGINTEFLPVT